MEIIPPESQDRLPFPKETVHKAAKAYLEKQIPTFTVQGQQTKHLGYENWLNVIKKEYLLMLKNKAQMNIL
jgi:hypothetical protein